MAITISGENNNDRILAADGVIDQISGINIVGLITASHINVGSNIQLGNACLLYTSPSPRDAHESRMPSSA